MNRSAAVNCVEKMRFIGRAYMKWLKKLALKNNNRILSCPTLICSGGTKVVSADKIPSTLLPLYRSEHVCVCVCVRACVRTCVRVCVRVCVCVCV